MLEERRTEIRPTGGQLSRLIGPMFCEALHPTADSSGGPSATSELSSSLNRSGFPRGSFYFATSHQEPVVR